MRGDDLFSLLVDYHCKENLGRCLPYMKKGRVHTYDQPIEEGEENELYKGLLLVSNGDTLINKLSEGGVIHDESEDLEFVTIHHQGDLASYLTKQRVKDGAYIFDSVNGRITRVGELNNNPQTLKERIQIYSMVPLNFLSSDGCIPLREMGTKTRLAIRMPLAYENTNSYLIKRTAYGDTGMGKVAYFSSDGLLEEFFFQYLPQHKGQFINSEQKILGVRRRWEKDKENNWQLLSENKVENPTQYLAQGK